MTNKQKTYVALVSSSVPAVSDGMSEPQEDTKKMLHHSKTEMMETLNDPCLSENDEEPLIQIFVNRCGTMAPICLEQHPSTTIFTLKEILQDQLGIQRENQHLSTLKGILLRDELSLEEQHIEQDANLELSIGPGLLGGRRKRRQGGSKKKANPENRSNERQSDSSPASTKPLRIRALSWLSGYLYPLWSYIASFSQQPEQNNLQIDANGPVIVGGGEMREQPEQNNLRIDANGPVIVGSASGNTFNTYLRGGNDEADSTTNDKADSTTDKGRRR